MLCFVITPGHASFNTCRNFTRGIPIFSCKNKNRHSLPANHVFLTWHTTLLNLWSKYLEGTIHSRLQKQSNGYHRNSWKVSLTAVRLNPVVSLTTEGKNLIFYSMLMPFLEPGSQDYFLYVISWDLPLYSTCQLKLHLWICTLVTPCPNVHVKKTKLVRGKVEM